MNAVQHVAHGILRSNPGVGESGAISRAIGVVKRWATGGGGVDANTRAAAAKAIAEWEALKAKQAAKSGGRSVAEQWVREADAYRATLADEMLVERDAMGRVVVLERQFGEAGLIGLLGESLLEGAAQWKPELRSAVKADGESERHHVYDGAQMVGTVSAHPSYDPKDGARWRARAVNGDRIGGPNLKSRSEALLALQTHLTTAPARVIALPTAGQFLVAKPTEYGQTSYSGFPSEQAARHAAGLPPSPSVPEQGAKVEALAEALRFDLMSVSGLDVPPLRRVQEARRRDPFRAGR